MQQPKCLNFCSLFVFSHQCLAKLCERTCKIHISLLWWRTCLHCCGCCWCFAITSLDQNDESELSPGEGINGSLGRWTTKMNSFFSPLIIHWCRLSQGLLQPWLVLGCWYDPFHTMERISLQNIWHGLFIVALWVQSLPPSVSWEVQLLFELHGKCVCFKIFLLDLGSTIIGSGAGLILFQVYSWSNWRAFSSSSLCSKWSVSQHGRSSCHCSGCCFCCFPW